MGKKIQVKTTIEEDYYNLIYTKVQKGIYKSISSYLREIIVNYFEQDKSFKLDLKKAKKRYYTLQELADKHNVPARMSFFDRNFSTDFLIYELNGKKYKKVFLLPKFELL